MPSLEERLAGVAQMAARRHESAARNLVAAQQDLEAAGELLLGLQERLGGGVASKANGPVHKQILHQIEVRYGVGHSLLTGPTKQRSVTLARQLAIYLYLELTGATFLDAAQTFNRSQQTILYSSQKVKERLKKSRLTRQLVKEMREAIIVAIASSGCIKPDEVRKLEEQEASQ